MAREQLASLFWSATSTQNAAEVASSTENVVYSNPSTTDMVRMGNADDNSDGFLDYKGRIDDVRLYDGALSGVNVQELYEEGGFTP